LLTIGARFSSRPDVDSLSISDGFRLISVKTA